MKDVPEHIRKELTETVFADVDQCRCVLRRRPGVLADMAFEEVPERLWLMRWMQWDRGGADEPDFRRYIVIDRKGAVHFGEWCFYERSPDPAEECCILMPQTAR